jgi:YVTN family beta-propeller protein
VRLKDFDRPVRLYQVDADGLPTEFPPPRSEAQPTDALEATIAAPVWRRRPVILAAVLAALAAVAAGLYLATRSATGGLSGVRPNNVGIIDPKTNQITDEVPVGNRPGPIAAGGAAVWVGNLDDRTLTKIDGRRGAPAGTFPLDNQTPTGIAVGFDSVWVVHGVALGTLSVVDPEFGQVKKRLTVAGEALGPTNGAVTVGAGAVWAVYADSTLARVDPGRLRVTGKTFTGAAPAGVVVANGYVWVVNTDSSTVQRFQPETFKEGPLGTPISVGRRPTAIAAGAGALWVANTGDDTVMRIELGTAGTAPTVEPIRVGDAPSALAVGGGAVWVANAGDGTVSRIDLEKGKVDETIRVGNAPSGIAFGDGEVWVSVQAP